MFCLELKWKIKQEQLFVIYNSNGCCGCVGKSISTRREETFLMWSRSCDTMFADLVRERERERELNIVTSCNITFILHTNV